MPQILRGTWFSWETGKPTTTVIDDISWKMRGECVTFLRDGADYTFVLKSDKQDCFHCVKTFPRTLNVFEKIEGSCVTLNADEEPSVERVCRGINDEQQLITLFNENYIPINCRSSLEGVWQFAYQVCFEKTENDRSLSKMPFFHHFFPTLFNRIVFDLPENVITKRLKSDRVKRPVRSS